MPDPNNPPSSSTPPVSLNPQDIANLQRAAGLLGNTINQMNKTMGGLSKILHDVTKTHYKELKEQEDAFSKFVYSKERNVYQKLLADRKKITRDLEVEEARKIRAIQNLSKGSADEKALRVDRVKSEYAEKRLQLEKASSKILNEASKAADTADGKRAFALDQLVGNVRGSLNKNLLDTKTLWEAVIVLMVTASQRLTNLTKASTAVRRAGLTGGYNLQTPGVGREILGGQMGQLEGKFKGIEQAVSNINKSDIDEFISMLAVSPMSLKAITSAGGAQTMTKFALAMGVYGISVKESMELIAKAGKSWNMSSKDLIKTFDVAGAITASTGLNFGEVFDSLLRINASLRSFTHNTSVASEVLTGLVYPLNKLGFAPDEIDKFSQSIADMLGHLSVSKTLGLAAFTRGIMPKTEAELKSIDPMKLVVDYMRKATGQFQNERDRILAISKLGSNLGIQGAETIQGAIGLKHVVDEFGKSSRAGESAMKKFREDHKSAADVQKEGADTLNNMSTTLENIEKALVNMLQGWNTALMPAMGGINSYIIPAFKKFSTPSSVSEGVKGYFASGGITGMVTTAAATLARDLRKTGTHPAVPKGR